MGNNDSSDMGYPVPPVSSMLNVSGCITTLVLVNNEAYHVRENQCIIPYLEQQSRTIWFAFFSDGKLIRRFNGAYVVSVHYKIPMPPTVVGKKEGAR